MFSIIEACFPEIEKMFDKKSLREFLSCDFNKLTRYHFGLGTWIRNHLLEEDSELKNMLFSGGIENKDDASMLIIRLFYVYERNRLLDFSARTC